MPLSWGREREERKAFAVTWLHFGLISARGLRECETGDTLFNTVPGSRTKPAVVKPQCCCCSCAAIGLIFTGLVPDMGCLLTAAIKHVQLHFLFFFSQLICDYSSHFPSGLTVYNLTVSILFLVLVLPMYKTTETCCLSAPVPSLSLSLSICCNSCYNARWILDGWELEPLVKNNREHRASLSGGLEHEWPRLYRWNQTVPVR